MIQIEMVYGCPGMVHVLECQYFPSFPVKTKKFPFIPLNDTRHVLNNQYSICTYHDHNILGQELGL
jgi:hypothetical protein